MLTNLELSPKQVLFSKTLNKIRRRRRLTIFNSPKTHNEQVNESWSPSNAKNNFTKNLKQLPSKRPRIPKRKFSFSDFDNPSKRRKKNN